MKKKIACSKLFATFCFIIVHVSLLAQDAPDMQKALFLVQKNADAIGLSKEDIINSRVSDTYDDVLSGGTLVYLQQTHDGIDVDRVMQVLAFKNDKLVSAAGKRIDLSFQSQLTAKEKRAVTPAITIENAIQAAATHLNLPAPSFSIKSVPNQDFSKLTDFGGMGIAKNNVTARLLWVQEKSDGRILLAWEVNISPQKTSDSWRVIVDAQKGNIIRKENYTIYENWNKEPKGIGVLKTPTSNHGDFIKNNSTYKNELHERLTSTTYRIIPFPAEAPSFPKGNPSLVTDPWELSPKGSGATPFIWNDDGSRQYKNTRGNNVMAYKYDSSGTVLRGTGTVYKDNLYFDYIPDFSKPPDDSVNLGFAITNLFYWNNIMHDLFYQYGFDEVSANFQQNNLGRGGKGYDFVYAIAQDEFAFNNGFFIVTPDGDNPQMSIGLFNGDPSKAMKINAPQSIAGNVTAVEGDVSPDNKLTNLGPVTGNVILYNDAADTFAIACSEAENKKELVGNIALIKRGNCFFTGKIINAQQAGAIAVIVTDNIPGELPFAMGGSDPSITIPAFMISYEDGIKINDVLSTGTAVNITLLPVPLTDADLDNGIIAHEYAHGISSRLTGGGSRPGCLYGGFSNGERMGEGISDYIALMTTTDWKKAGINGAKPRSGATYALNEPPNGSGDRQYPYSTNMKINPHTYADVGISDYEPHAIGEVWASIMWDMTWNIIEMDGINKDIFNAIGSGGNTVALKLAMEGMKLQPCVPGFVDGRDAILKADTLLYNGKYSCAIWKAFARRGIGTGASQGSSEIIGDETVDFSLGTIFITKHAGKKNTAPGKNITYSIGLKAKAVCGADIRQNYSIKDSLPSNVTYVNSDGTYNPANRTISFDNIDMNSGDSVTYTVKATVSDNSYFPDSVYLNDYLTYPFDKWVTKNSEKLAWTIFQFSWYHSGDASVKSDEKLVTKEAYLIPGIKTTLSFQHFFQTDDYKNGGVVEITTDGGKHWEDLGPYMEPKGVNLNPVYTETITGNSILAGRKAFSGYGYGETIIDLSSFAGKKVKIRFLYATSDGSIIIPIGQDGLFGTGWIISGIVLSASPVVSNTAKLFNGKHEQKGFSTVVTPLKGKNIPAAFAAVKQNEKELLEDSQEVTVFPNPAKNRIKVSIPGNDKIVQLQFTDVSGKLIKTYTMIGQYAELKLPPLSPGAYYLNIIRSGTASKHKVIIE